jgi:hypothetical protein
MTITLDADIMQEARYDVANDNHESKLASLMA